MLNAKANPAPVPRDQTKSTPTPVTMDYQLGFASGSGR